MDHFYQENYMKKFFNYPYPPNTLFNQYESNNYENYNAIPNINQLKNDSYILFKQLF